MLQISWRLMNLSCIKVRPYRCPMKDENSLGRLKELENESAAIRHRLGISSPREVIYQASINPVDEETVVVEADGFGVATLKIVEGNYPIDFLCLREARFRSEPAALREAERLVSEAA